MSQLIKIVQNGGFKDRIFDHFPDSFRLVGTEFFSAKKMIFILRLTLFTVIIFTIFTVLGSKMA